MSKFSEEKLVNVVNVVNELLEQEGYAHHLGLTITCNLDEVYVEIFEQAENFKRNQQ